MEFFVELLLNVLAELFAPLLGELLSRLFFLVFRTAAVPFENRVGFVATVPGAALGGASLLLLPHPIVAPVWLKIVNLLVAPVVIGWLAMQLGRFRAERGKEAVPTDTFMYGYVFTLVYLAIRWIFAK